MMKFRKMYNINFSNLYRKKLQISPQDVSLMVTYVRPKSVFPDGYFCSSSVILIPLRCPGQAHERTTKEISRVIRDEGRTHLLSGLTPELLLETIDYNLSQIRDSKNNINKTSPLISKQKKSMKF